MCNNAIPFKQICVSYTWISILLKKRGYFVQKVVLSVGKGGSR